MNKKMGFGIALLLAIAFTAFAQQYTSEKDFKTKRAPDGKSVIITSYTGKDTDVRLPLQINKRPVTAIGNEAFVNKQLTSVTIPDGVTTIGSGAFKNNQLTSVTIPDSVTSVGDEAFRDNRLTSITIPVSVTFIGSRAFMNNQLTSVAIPNSVTYIGNNAFAYNQLTSVTIPDSVTLGDGVFAGNGQLANAPMSRAEQQRAEQERQKAQQERQKAEQQAQQERQKAEQQAQQEQAEQAEQTRLANLYRQAGNNVGNLRNTSKSYSDRSLGALYTARYDFGNGNYVLEAGFPRGGLLFGLSTTTGTFRVNGDTVIFLSSEGEYSFGTIIGTTIIIDDDVYR
jgi:protein required for attachment to host cells